jgi:acyl-CoA synthetase (AMP-forming)/AMP-acid ligase II
MIQLTVGRALRLAAQSRPHSVAITFDGKQITYGEFEAQSNRIARALARAGLKKGDRLGVMLHNSDFYLSVIVGAAKAGVALVLLNYRFTGGELAYHLDDAGAMVLLHDSLFSETAHSAREQIAGLRLLEAGSRSLSGTWRLDDLAAAESDDPPDVQVNENDLLVLQYTSGTTGRPKGAIITHRNRSLAFLHWPTIFGYGKDDVILHAGPLHHSAPMGMTLSQLCLGGRAVVMQSFKPDEALRLIAQEQVTWAFLVPYMYSAICHWLREQPNEISLPSLRILLSGASPLPTPIKDLILQAFPKAGLFEFYGATEAGTITALRPEDQKRKIRSVGKPVLGAEVKILSHDRQPLPCEEVGEIWLRTPSLFEGYFNAPDKTEAAFDGEWCTLGDLGRMDDEGYLYIVDRVKDVIKSGGVNIYPSEIEEAVLLHPDVIEAAVIGVPNERWGESVHLVAVPRPGSVLLDADLISHCRQHLADYKVPKSVELRNDLPRSPAGKVLKRSLRLPYWPETIKV